MNATRASLLFAITLAVFIIGPALLPEPFGPYPLLHWGDILDVATPIVVLPAAWLLFRAAGGSPPTTTSSVLFVALAGLWASAQGMHLAANAIGHLTPEGSGDLSALVHDLDEVISHYLWHAAWLGLAALIVVRSIHGQPEADAIGSTYAAMAVGAAVFGVTWFIVVVEGATGLLGLPGAVVIAVAGLLAGKGGLAQRPAASLFVFGYLVSIALAIAWAGTHGWQLVEFSKAGLIE